MIVPARAHDELLLHMQQSFAQGYAGLNVRSCRLASRSTSTRRRHAGLPQVIGRQNPAWQQRIVRHRLQPDLALRRRPAQQRLRRRVVPQRAARSFAEDFQMPGIAAVATLEVPRTRDDFRAASTLTRPGGHPLPSDGRGNSRTTAPPAGGAISH